jgi:hypothetical protein
MPKNTEMMSERDRKKLAAEELKRTGDSLKQGSHYSEEAILKMVNLIYDPLTIALCAEIGIADEAHLLSLTLINSSREAWHWSVQLMKEAALLQRVRLAKDEAPKLHQRTWPLSKVQRVAFLLARRSLTMTAFKLGVGLAQEQNIAKAEEEEEPYED